MIDPMLRPRNDLFRLATAILLASTFPIYAAIGVATLEAEETGGSGLEGLVGTWELAGESRYGDLLHVLVVAADGTATYESGGEVADVTQLEIDGNKVRFNMTVFGGPGSYELAFEGSYDDNALTGDILSSGASFASVRAPRVADEYSILVGTWTLTGSSQYGPLEHTLVVAADGTATYASSGEVSEVRNLEIDADKVRFEMTVWGGHNSYEMTFEGDFDEARLTGDILTNGASFATLTAPRQPRESS